MKETKEMVLTHEGNYFLEAKHRLGARIFNLGEYIETTITGSNYKVKAEEKTRYKTYKISYNGNVILTINTILMKYRLELIREIRASRETEEYEIAKRLLKQLSFTKENFYKAYREYKIKKIRNYMDLIAPNNVQSIVDMIGVPVKLKRLIEYMSLYVGNTNTMNVINNKLESRIEITNKKYSQPFICISFYNIGDSYCLISGALVIYYKLITNNDKRSIAEFIKEYPSIDIINNLHINIVLREFLDFDANTQIIFKNDLKLKILHHDR